MDEEFEDKEYETEEYSPHLKKLILEVVDNQIRENNPPITKETLQRLMAAGHTRQEAREMIGAVVIGHIYDMMKDLTKFDEKKYAEDLAQLK